MISDRRRQFFRFLLFVLYSQLFAGFQTSFWTHLFGTITPPAFWVMLVAYIALFRGIGEGLVTLFFISFSFSVYTSLPEGLLTLALLVLFSSIRFLKTRVFVPTTFYFAATSALSLLGFYLCHGIFSHVFELIPVTSPEILPTLAQTVLTFLFAFPIFALLQFSDYFLRDEAKEGWGAGGADSWRGHEL